MYAEEEGGEIDGEEAPKEVRERMVVAGHEGVGRGLRVVVRGVKVAERAGLLGMQNKAVDIVLQYLETNVSLRNFKLRSKLLTYLTQSIASSNVLQHCHWQRKCGRYLQSASNAEDVSEQHFNTCLDSNTQTDVEEAESNDLVPWRPTSPSRSPAHATRARR